MSARELREKLEAYKLKLAKSQGLITSGPAGPVGISIVEEVVAAIEELQRTVDQILVQLAELERRISLSG